MKINISIDMSDYWGDDYNNMSDLIDDIIKKDIERKLKKLPEYKAFIQRKTDQAIGQLDLN